MNILTYAKNLTDDFAQTPFNRVDALILSWLSYYCFPDYLNEGEGVALCDIPSRGALPDGEMYAEAFNQKTSKRLFVYLTESPRFRGVALSDYRAERDEETEKQFACICAEISPNEYFLAFRGTDPSFIGWKEDFNLACKYPVPSQRAALGYLREEMRKRPDGKFHLGGHSKGGNLAVYAAINADESLQKRLVSVYNFDGPGFMTDIYSERGYAGVSDKIIKVVPNSSLIGMLFETHDCFSIVKSRNLSVLQHDPFSWLLKDNDFIYLTRRTKLSIKLEKAVNDWISEIPLDERERVVGMISDGFDTLDTNDVNEFLKTFYKQIPALYREYKQLKSEDKDFFAEKLSRLKELLLKKA